MIADNGPGVIDPTAFINRYAADIKTNKVPVWSLMQKVDPKISDQQRSILHQLSDKERKTLLGELSKAADPNDAFLQAYAKTRKIQARPEQIARVNYVGNDLTAITPAAITCTRTPAKQSKPCLPCPSTR